MTHLKGVNNMKPSYLRKGAIAFAFMTMSGCEMPMQIVGNYFTADVVPTGQKPADPVVQNPGDPNTNPPSQPGSDNQVCEAFGGNGVRNERNGLFAKLYYMDSTDPKSVNDFFGSKGKLVDADLYFSQLNVPTRKFDLGFVNLDGELLKNQKGDTLYEYFALRFDSNVKLTRNQRAGKYQFAVISDDGAVLKLATDANQDGSPKYETLVNNDYITPSRMACANRAIRFDESSRFPIKVDYYQGPRYHIALMVLFREIPESVDETKEPAALYESLCGRSGNGLFFDYNQVPSKPTKEFLDLLSRGWKVLEPENYVLSEEVQDNPCVNPTPTVRPPGSGGNDDGVIGI